MCKEQTNFQELIMALSQFRRRGNNMLYDLHEWKHYAIHAQQNQVAKNLEQAEGNFEDALRAIEEALKIIDLPISQKKEQDMTITVIKK